jgi:hypothetical protein
MSTICQWICEKNRQIHRQSRLKKSSFDKWQHSMPSDTDKLKTVKQYMRRKWDAATLRTKADELFELATEEVTITSNGFEGGNAAGQVTFPKIIMLQAIEELILEKDPDNTDGAPGGSIHPDFSTRTLST